MNYLECSGLIFNGLIVGTILYALWVLIAWPMVEAFSQCRWYVQIGSNYPEVKPSKGWIGVWWSCLEIGGRSYDSKSNRYGTWSGVGKWKVYTNEGGQRKETQL